MSRAEYMRNYRAKKKAAVTLSITLRDGSERTFTASDLEGIVRALSIEIVRLSAEVSHWTRDLRATARADAEERSLEAEWGHLRESDVRPFVSFNPAPKPGRK